MIYYALHDQNQQAVGFFSTPEKAMEYVYLISVYQMYRGYVNSIEPVFWRNSANIHWYAYSKADGLKLPAFRGTCLYTITLLRLDQMPPMPDDLREFVTQKNLPILSQSIIIADYLEKFDETTD